MQASVINVIPPGARGNEGSGQFRVDIGFKNTCRTPQLLAYFVAFEPSPTYYHSYTHESRAVPTLGWNKPAPVNELGYPHVLHGPAVAFGVYPDDTAVIKTYREPKGVAVTNVQIGSCDLNDVNGVQQVAFRNAQQPPGVEGFKCLPNHPK